LAGTIKDVIPRYQTMRGNYVERTFGWDCHGLPVENEVEKELGLKSKTDIEEFGIDKFNEECRKIVLRYSSEWEVIVERMGRWVDFENGYKTMDLSYMESIWWVFKQLWDKKLIYEGNKIMWFCPRCSTPLSNFEVNQGYKDVEDPAITVRFQSCDDEDTYYLAWTTTPWTLSGNLALTVGNDIDYVEVDDEGTHYILAAARVSAYWKEEPNIIKTFKGSELLSKRYKPLYPYFEDLRNEGAFQIVADDFVNTSDGTGIVHTAPGFGEDDNRVCKENNIPVVCPIDNEGKYSSEITAYAGRFVKDCDKDIIKDLKDAGNLIHRTQYHHSYPHCWRCESPLLNKAISTWFVDVESIKDKMINANNQIRWVPDHLKSGRFGKWLEGARDWAISRNRYWGCPLPIWRNEDSGEIICVGSVSELESLSGQTITDIHKHFVDKIELEGQGGTKLQRVTEVLDCWFESGSMPYAQKHYPFNNQDWLDSHFPADFIAEGQDQTRGWFYTLTVLGAALFDKPAFQNVIVNGMVLAEDGKKMSKSLKNYPDPTKVMDTYGADAMRLYLLCSPVVRCDDLKFSTDGVQETMRSVLIPFWNSYSFFVTYANVDGWQPEGAHTLPKDLNNPLDQWVISRLEGMVKDLRHSMDNYDLQSASLRFTEFVDQLTNWYIRRSRRRFWKSQNDTDKAEAYATLYHVLITFCKSAAPFIPFLTESIYKNLRHEDMPESVHLCDYPEYSESALNENLDSVMQCAMTSVSLGRYLRSQAEIRVRQPLSEIILVSLNEQTRDHLHEIKDIVMEELNVKSVSVKENELELVELSAVANFKKLGKELGKRMK
ncbi:MAG: isoleucine--tRNA ligase, partial [Lentisphaeria bacterium]|nr:isoleucine--tRNA ligase [Lentisphaeria bacterium]